MGKAPGQRQRWQEREHNGDTYLCNPKRTV